MIPYDELHLVDVAEVPEVLELAICRTYPAFVEVPCENVFFPGLFLSEKPQMLVVEISQ